MSKEKHSAPIVRNKKARHYYELLEFVEAGIVLLGTEVKSLRAGHANFHDAYMTFTNDEAFLVGLRIAPYANSGYASHDPDRIKKLLLHRHEIESLRSKVEQKGLTVVPLNLHYKAGKIKVELALGKGKKLHDQRQTLKDRAENRDAEREMSARYGTE